MSSVERETIAALAEQWNRGPEDEDDAPPAWFTASQYRPKVGDRVRVLARPECFYCREDHDAEVGETGVITHIHLPPYITDMAAAMAHQYWVRFDDPTIAERTLAGVEESHFAACELEPQTPADAGADARGEDGAEVAAEPARREGA